MRSRSRSLKLGIAACVGVLAVAASCGGSESADPEPGANGSDSGASSEVTASVDRPSSLQPGEPTGAGGLVDASATHGIDAALAGIRGHAVAAADVNGDGWIDLFVGTFADRPPESYQFRGAEGPAPDRLLLGGSDGFTIDESFEGRLGRTAGAAFADLDADGDPDLIVSRNVRDSERASAPSEIYRNDDGSLVPAVTLDDSRGGRAVTTLDFDQDGQLDVVLAEDRWSGASSALFRNEGDLAFTDVTAAVGLPTDVFGLGVAAGDLNGDGIDDLVFGGSNRWFLGDGSGFSEGSTSPLPWTLHNDEDDPAHVLLVDANGDDRLDIFIGQHFNSTLDFDIPEPVRLYMNDGSDGDAVSFTDVTSEVGLPELTTKSPQLLLADIDGDGASDLVTTATYDEDGARLPVVVDIGFVDGGLPTFTTDAPDADPHYWIDGVVLDANGDGRLDLFFVEWEPELGSRLLLNLPE